jgi:hypothetical protein
MIVFALPARAAETRVTLPSGQKLLVLVEQPEADADAARK